MGGNIKLRCTKKLKKIKAKCVTRILCSSSLRLKIAGKIVDFSLVLNVFFDDLILGYFVEKNKVCIVPFKTKKIDENSNLKKVAEWRSIIKFLFVFKKLNQYSTKPKWHLPKFPKNFNCITKIFNV